MDLVKAYASTVKNFIPQIEIDSKNRRYVRWNRGPEYVEVQFPGTGIRKQGLREKRAWIVASFIYSHKQKNGRTVYKQITSSFEYRKSRLEALLKELNRCHN